MLLLSFKLKFMIYSVGIQIIIIVIINELYLLTCRSIELYDIWLFNFFSLND